MRYVLLFMLSILIQTISAAEVYKCQGEGGKVVFQKFPCPGVDNAKPMDLKQPSPNQLLKMQIEATQRALEEEHRLNIKRQRDFEKAIRQAELDAIKAREKAWKELDYDIQQSREDSARRRAELECQQKRRTDRHARCFELGALTTDQ